MSPRAPATSAAVKAAVPAPPNATSTGTSPAPPRQSRARDAALDELGLSFKSAMAGVRRLRGRDTHRPGELSFAQYSLLFGLAERGELSTSEAALAADLAPATVTQMLDSLAAAGLVARVRCERDRRVVLTSLTERGRDLVEERRARFEPRWREALAEFTTDELASAAAVLDRLRAMFESLDEA